MSARRILLELFDAALRAVHGREAVTRTLRRLRPTGSISVFAVGKAASSMVRGAHEVLGSDIVDTFVVTKEGHADPELARLANLVLLESAHPVPDERSLAAGVELERRLRALPAETTPLFLVSGGSSALVESLVEGVRLEELRLLNVRGLAAGWDIARLNGERSKLSKLKGGGVAQLLGQRRGLALFVSDVGADDPDVIGSGLLGKRRGSADRIERVVVACVDDATRAAAECARAQGIELEPLAKRIQGDVSAIAAAFVRALRDTTADGVVWGGESTVELPTRHGRGGRNTHLALSLARMLKPDEPLTILAAGTDGTDGPTDDAGAIVDAGSIERAELAGCDVERAFREFDSGTALEAAGDLVYTGPTGTNVGDLLIGLRNSGKTPRGLGLPRMF